MDQKVVKLMVAFSFLKSSFCCFRVALEKSLDKFHSCLGESRCPS